MKDKSKDLLTIESLFKNKSTPSLAINTGNNLYAKMTPNTYVSTTIASKILFL